MAESMQFLPKRDLLNFEEIVELADIFIERGVRRIRLTGGRSGRTNDLSQCMKGAWGYSGDTATSDPLRPPTRSTSSQVRRGLSPGLPTPGRGSIFLKSGFQAGWARLRVPISRY